MGPRGGADAETPRRPVKAMGGLSKPLLVSHQPVLPAHRRHSAGHATPQCGLSIPAVRCRRSSTAVSAKPSEGRAVRGLAAEARTRACFTTQDTCGRRYRRLASSFANTFLPPDALLPTSLERMSVRGHPRRQRAIPWRPAAACRFSSSLAGGRGVRSAGIRSPQVAGRCPVR